MWSGLQGASKKCPGIPGKVAILRGEGGGARAQGMGPQLELRGGVMQSGEGLLLPLEAQANFREPNPQSTDKRSSHSSKISEFFRLPV